LQNLEKLEKTAEENGEKTDIRIVSNYMTELEEIIKNNNTST
jgi:hypothetical protein